MIHDAHAKAQRMGTGVAVFAASFAVLYGLCDVWRWPMFSYYPATGRMDWGWTPETADDGPAMYWYGWIASSFIGALASALTVMGLPVGVRRLISLHIAWIIPLFMIPVMAYTLRVYWR
jgi:hypothetical protein